MGRGFNFRQRATKRKKIPGPKQSRITEMPVAMPQRPMPPRPTLLNNYSFTQADNAPLISAGRFYFSGGMAVAPLDFRQSFLHLGWAEPA